MFVTNAFSVAARLLALFVVATANVMVLRFFAAYTERVAALATRSESNLPALQAAA